MTIKNVIYCILASFLFVFSCGAVSYGISSYFVKEIQVEFELNLIEVYIDESEEELIETTIMSTDTMDGEIEKTDDGVELNEEERNDL